MSAFKILEVKFSIWATNMWKIFITLPLHWTLQMLFLARGSRPGVSLHQYWEIWEDNRMVMHEVYNQSSFLQSKLFFTRLLNFCGESEKKKSDLSWGNLEDLNPNKTETLHGILPIPFEQKLFLRRYNYVEKVFSPNRPYRPSLSQNENRSVLWGGSTVSRKILLKAR